MKLNTEFRKRIEAIENIGFVLDIGFGYPYELIELYHLYNANKCIGVDLKEKQSAVSCSFVVNEISESTNIERRKIFNIINDFEIDRELYNSYKVYTSLVLDKDPMDFGQFERNIELHYKKNILDYLNNDNKWIPYYDIIIASKVLSHMENGTQILDSLIDKLSEKGIIYLRLNSEDYEVQENQGILDSTIVSPFDELRLTEVLDKLTVLERQTLKREDGKREFIIIGQKKNDL